MFAPWFQKCERVVVIQGSVVAIQECRREKLSEHPRVDDAVERVVIQMIEKQQVTNNNDCSSLSDD